MRPVNCGFLTAFGMTLRKSVLQTPRQAEEEWKKTELLTPKQASRLTDKDLKNPSYKRQVYPS